MALSRVCTHITLSCRCRCTQTTLKPSKSAAPCKVPLMDAGTEARAHHRLKCAEPGSETCKDAAETRSVELELLWSPVREEPLQHRNSPKQNRRTAPKPPKAN